MELSDRKQEGWKLEFDDLKRTVIVILYIVCITT